MPQLVGLPGRRKPLDCEIFGTVKRAAALLSRGLGAAANGENGAISLWPVKDGVRGELLQFRRVIEDKTWPDMEAAGPTIRKWLREIRKPNARCAEIKRQILSGEYDFREAE